MELDRCAICLRKVDITVGACRDCIHKLEENKKELVLRLNKINTLLKKYK